MRRVSRVRGARPMAVAMRVVLAHIRLAILGAQPIAVQTRQARREEEENGIQDAKGEGGFEHCARLVHVDVDAVQGSAPEDTQRDIRRRTPGHIGAVGVGNEAQGVDGSDEGPYEEDVDYGHEGGVGGRPVVTEDGEERPGTGEYRHDEEHEDVRWCERVALVVPVDEVC
ncbi:hypothetical protein NPX13_g9003 [Xylaria arbuscula]|uniref:Uncharacterized protein n=1 Tax=Xylaria arbuscula TaxID=114810 RepID=A0A9W8TIX2_9PEZI|nr:hypothetical protein NPX13_g9003 [Xylaria arbuscula]